MFVSEFIDPHLLVVPIFCLYVNVCVTLMEDANPEESRKLKTFSSSQLAFDVTGCRIPDDCALCKQNSFRNLQVNHAKIVLINHFLLFYFQNSFTHDILLMLIVLILLELPQLE